MFLINLQGKESIYEQIKTQIETFINNGILKANDKLPSVRNLAQDLGINPNTVMKAYQELEKNGYIYTLNKKGVFVSKDLKVAKKQNKRNVESLISALKNEGYSKKEILDVIDTVYEKGDE
jgi:GntR family transcriptional regulator